MDKEKSLSMEVQPPKSHEVLISPPVEVLVASYLGEIYAYKTIQYAKEEKDSYLLNLIAKCYSDFPDRIRSLFDTTLEQENFSASKLGISQAIALSFARNGDFQGAESLIYSDEPPTMSFLLEYAGIRSEQGRDSSDAYRIATEMAANSNDSLSELEKVILSQIRNKQDTQGTFGEYDRIRKEKEEKYPYPYMHTYLGYAKLLLKSGRIEDAIQVLQDESKDNVGFDNAVEELRLEIAEALAKQGRVKEALDLLPPKVNNSQHNEYSSLTRIITSKESLTPDDELLFEAHDGMFVRYTKRNRASNWIKLQKVEVDFRRGREIYTLLDEIVSSALEENTDGGVDDIRKVISLSEKVGLNTDDYIQKLLTNVHEVIDNIDFTDKLSPIEALMTYEDTVEFLIDHGYMREGIRMAQLYERAFPKDNSGDKITEDGLTEKIYAAVAQKYFTVVKNSETTHTRVDVTKNLILKATGYYNLLYNSINLTPSDQMHLELGRRERLIVEGRHDELEPIDLSRDGNSARNYATTLKEGIDTLALQLLKQQLNKELAGSNDPTTIRRLVKELLETGDQEVQSLAAEMFVDPSQPFHFRVYLAKKLCDEGAWDRQILFYFKEYRKKTGQMPEAREKLETLETIITQMHQTPNLKMYKVLEKTRKEKDTTVMQKVAQFGAEVLQIDGFNLDDRINLFSYWADQYIEGSVSETELDELTKRIQNLGDAWLTYYNRHSKFDKNTNIKDATREFLTSREIFDGIEAAQELLNHGIFPTKSLVRHMRTSGHASISDLKKLQKQTEDGNFDRGNKIQRDLEFTNFLKIALKADLSTLQKTFARLPSSDELKEQPELNYKEKYEARAAAFECALLYWFVKGLIDNGRNVVVVGNKRYGEYFVVEPLRYYLAKQGVNMQSLYVKSSDASETSYPEDIPDNFIRLLSTETPDIVIVDGTKNRADQKAYLPKSFLSYKNWFEAFNASQNPTDTLDLKSTNPRLQRLASFHAQSRYHIRFWTPSGEEKAQLGNNVIGNEESSDDLPSVYFVNSSVTPQSFPNYPRELHDHIPAYFDDPNTHIVGREKIVFTKFGVKNSGEKFLLEEGYVREVQNEIEKWIPQYIRTNDPLLGVSQPAEYRGSYRFTGT